MNYISKKLSQIEVLESDLKKIESDIRAHLFGKTIKIISNYNGQPHGSSKKSMKGLVCKIGHVSYIPFLVNSDNIFVWIEGKHSGYPGLGISEIELLR